MKPFFFFFDGLVVVHSASHSTSRVVGGGFAQFFRIVRFWCCIPGHGFLIVCFILFLQIQNIKYFSFFKDYILSIRLVNILIIFFLVSLFVFNSDFFNPYVYRTSSYIWTIGAFFVSLYLFKDIKKYNKLSKLAAILLVFLPPVHYLFSTGFYPNFIMDIFIQYSDKFSFPKASDIMLSLVIVNLLNFRIFNNKKFNLFYPLLSLLRK